MLTTKQFSIIFKVIFFKSIFSSIHTNIYFSVYHSCVRYAYWTLGPGKIQSLSMSVHLSVEINRWLEREKLYRLKNFLLCVWY